MSRHHPKWFENQTSTRPPKWVNSTRTMAGAMGLSQTAVSRIWRAFCLQPHRHETFKLSTDPMFVDKVRDIVGLYMDPPLTAMVLPDPGARSHAALAASGPRHP